MLSLVARRCTTVQVVGQLSRCAIASTSTVREPALLPGRPTKRANSTVAVPQMTLDATAEAVMSQMDLGATDLTIPKSLIPCHSVPGLVNSTTLIVEKARLPHLKTMVEMADALCESDLLDAGQQAELQSLIAQQGPKKENGEWPLWIEGQYDALIRQHRTAQTPEDRAYREARSMLWTPKGMDAAALDDLLEQHRKSLSEEWRQWAWSRWDRQEQLDRVLRARWDALSDQKRKEALVRCEYECIRKLGWRRGYTSGYPTEDPTIKDERKKLLTLVQDLNRTNPQRLEDVQQWFQQEDEEAWTAWQALTSPQRKAEYKDTWNVRDRSLIYIDDTSSSTVADLPKSRWYEAPQRVGDMTFLPNVVIKLVRNYTPPKEQYDAFKATFRVPLNMHKHALRSYLLAIYGLRTTWCRSMIYRAPIERNYKGQKVVGNSRRTFKKVEVGLLEPFVFPEISQEFVNEHFMLQELKTAQHRQRFSRHASNRYRTRGKDPAGEVRPDPHSASVDASRFEEIYTTDPKNADGQIVTRKRTEADKKKPTVTKWKSGLPTKSRKAVLASLNNKRSIQEAKIAAEAHRLQRGHAQAAST